jgi:UDP-3-O-[3-hydroxymyristoyl] glucosamine N-acyltransferase
VKFTLEQINERIGGKIEGDGAIEITSVGSITDAGVGQITFLANPCYIRNLSTSTASAIIIAPDIKPPKDKNLIIHENPSIAFMKAMELFCPAPRPVPHGIDKSASVDPGSEIDPAASIQAMAYVGPGTKIGAGTVVSPLSYIGEGCTLGQNCLIYPNVTILDGSQIGDNVIIHSSSVIGSDGYGYITVDDRHTKIPQNGIVVIEDDVEIGSNVSIDRARFDKTIIKQGVKIDNLVQIAHNVTIEKNCLVVAQCGISGSTEVGEASILAGQAGIGGHLKIGHHSVITAQSGLGKSIEPKSMFSGSPARPFQQEQRAKASVYKLPDLIKTVRALEKKVKELEEAAQVNQDT